MLGPDGKPAPVTDWLLRYDDVAEPQERLREALCTLGNGYFATRGAAPESHADGVHYPGAYIAGCFNALQTLLAGRTTENESLVNAPNWLGLTFRARTAPGSVPAASRSSTTARNSTCAGGVLTRRRRVRDDLGHITRITHRRFVHMGAARGSRPGSVSPRRDRCGRRGTRLVRCARWLGVGTRTG